MGRADRQDPGPERRHAELQRNLGHHAIRGGLEPGAVPIREGLGNGPDRQAQFLGSRNGGGRDVVALPGHPLRGARQTIAIGEWHGIPSTLGDGDDARLSGRR
jgi:hypothetical protein